MFCCSLFCLRRSIDGWPSARARLSRGVAAVPMMVVFLCFPASFPGAPESIGLGQPSYISHSLSPLSPPFPFLYANQGFGAGVPFKDLFHQQGLAFKCFLGITPLPPNCEPDAWIPVRTRGASLGGGVLFFWVRPCREGAKVGWLPPLLRRLKQAHLRALLIGCL